MCITRNNSFEYIEEMDASNTCSLVNTQTFMETIEGASVVDYRLIVTSATALIEFSMNSNYTTLKTAIPAGTPTNDFTRFITTASNFSTGKPVLLGGAQSIVKGYLGYPILNSQYSNDYYTRSTFRNLSNVVLSLITSSNLCSSSNIYNATEYTGANIADVSLTTLYRIKATSNLNPQDATTIQNQIDLFQNKNMMFYSFFTCEYCYYRSMYTTLLGQYFIEYQTIAPTARAFFIEYLKDGTGAPVTQAQTIARQTARLDAILITLARVNSRLTDMRQLLIAIQDYYSASVQELQATLNQAGGLGSDTDAQQKVTSLKTQSSLVLNEKDESAFRQGIMEYTSEKNRYSNILLGIYAFLNIAVIAVIFNIKE